MSGLRNNLLIILNLNYYSLGETGFLCNSIQTDNHHSIKQKRYGYEQQKYSNPSTALCLVVEESDLDHHVIDLGPLNGVVPIRARVSPPDG